MNQFIKSILIGASLTFLGMNLNAQNKLTKDEKKNGWKLLFDGKTTTKWRGAFLTDFPKNGWKIMDGLLMVEPSGGAESTNGGDIVTIKQYQDFELSVDFKLSKGANSGIKYFVDVKQAKPANPRSALGLEYQLLDDEIHPDAKLGKNGNRKLGSLYDLIPAPANKPVNPVGEWNTAKIIAIGNHVEHWLNGVKLIAYERGSKEFRDLVAGSKYKDIVGFGLIESGSILLQDHGNKVYYRNIKIRAIETKSVATNPAVVSYTFRNEFQKDVPATLDYIKGLGITNIEFSNLFGKSAIELRKLLDERGMVCTSFGVSYPDFVNHTDEVGNDTKTLGASFVRVAWVPHDSKAGFTLADAEKTVQDFNKGGKLLKEQFGLTFCYHNHGYEFAPYEKGTYFDYIATNTNPDYVSFELDLLWAFHPGADPVKLIKKYGNRFKLMHVKDLKKGVIGNFSGGTDVNNDVALGTGQIDIANAIKAALNSSSIKYYYIEDESEHVKTQVPISLTYLNSILTKFK
ncbi:family 16 glycoside hydrolase [Pedobacter lithocola]|uniref:Family 16 glycoside hydrolase n=1 Tax=Pedobacter lithocola TaxID=1908239 RepID=A0ABV8PCP5_9SPHI